jgi:hypothetical protein
MRPDVALASPRSFDGAVRAVQQHYEKVECIHLNPVRAALVERAGDWPWSSARDYTGSLGGAAKSRRVSGERDSALHRSAQRRAKSCESPPDGLLD